MKSDYIITKSSCSKHVSSKIQHALVTSSRHAYTNSEYITHRTSIFVSAPEELKEK
jgi:hypothetical protein